MTGHTRLLALLLTAVIFAAQVSVASGKASHRGPLTGTWSGAIGGSGRKPVHIVIVINAAQTGGSWRLSAACHGRLTLDSISGGYHHYLRHFAGGGNCAGGDIDCLKRVGANVYDAVTSLHSGKYGTGGTLHRTRA
ncbi:MAG: hypothetical protein ACYC0H_13100 [Solirubrobacteraceae bacterium]